MTTIPPEVPKIQAETTRAGVGSPIGSMLTGERVEPISPQERFTPVQQTAGKTEVVSADVMKKSAEEAKKQLDAIKQAVTFLDEGRRSKRGTKAVPSSSVEKTVGTSPGPLDVVEKLITDLKTIDLTALSFDQKTELKNLTQTMLVASNLFYHFSKEKNLIFQEFIKRLSENIASNYEQIKKIKTAQSRLQDVSDTVFPDMKAAYGDLIERGKRLAISVKQKTDTEISEAANAFEKEATAFASKYEQIKKIKTAQSRLRQLFVPVSPEMKAAYDGLTRQGETLTNSLKEKTDTEISEAAANAFEKEVTAFESKYRQIRKIQNAQFRLKQLSDKVFPEMRAAYDGLVEQGKTLTSSLKQKTDTEISETANAFEKEVSAFESKYEQIRKIQNAQFRLKQLSVTVFPEMKTAYDDLVKRGETLTSSLKEKLDTVPSEDAYAFEEKVTAFEDSIIDHFVTESGCSRDEAKKIFTGAQNNWEGLYEEEKDGIIKQTHDIPHLKIYKDPATGGLIADYGIKEIGKGSFKRAKTILQIGGETRVRLTSAKKARERELQTLIEKEGALGEKADAAKLQKFHDELAKLQSTFLLDIGGEDKAREVLKDVPNIAGMTKIQYWSREKPGKPSQLKTRYIMTKYEGDLWSLAITSTEQADHEKALRCCMGVFDCLQKMHEKGFVHGDLKLFNVLFKGDTGFVSDFGFCREEGCPFPHVGNPVYMAPEGVFGSNKLYNKSMDMFSFGIMLLAIVDPSRYLQWEEAMKELKKIKTGDGAKPQDQYKQTYLDSHATLMADLAKRQDPICKELIVPLLNLDPEKRPKINAAKETFTRLLKGPKVRP